VPPRSVLVDSREPLELLGVTGILLGTLEPSDGLLCSSLPVYGPLLLSRGRFREPLYGLGPAGMLIEELRPLEGLLVVSGDPLWKLFLPD
jgi:hypothetical protein